jgi:hypothetical protein
VAKVEKKNGTNGNGEERKFVKKFDSKQHKTSGDKKFVKKFDNKSGKPNNGKSDTPLSKKDQKELKIQRKQKKLAHNYSVSLNIKKIWETLRRFVILI